MIIKSFTAESAAAALKKVRSEMGGDAVVLKTRELSRRSRDARVEITACLDKPTVAQTSNIFPDRKQGSGPSPPDKKSETSRLPETPVVPDEPVITAAAPETIDRLAAMEAKLDKLVRRITFDRISSARNEGEVLELYQKLQDADFPADYLEKLFDRLDEKRQQPEEIYAGVSEYLTDDLAEIIESEFTLEAGDRVLIYGPAGTGKSSVMGKLAARLICEKKKIKLVSLDNLKVGAFEELANYADLLGVDTVKAAQVETSENKKTEEIVLIDSPAIPFNESKLNEFRIQAEQVKPTHRIVVLSSLMRSGDIADMAETIKLFNPTHLVMTMTDATARLGSVTAACRQLGVKLVYVTDTPAGIGRVNKPSVEQIIRTVLKEEGNLEQA